MRYVDEQELLKQAAKGTAALERWLSRQPRVPRLMGRAAAADLLGIKSPHIARLHEQGRMPDPVEVDGTSPVYLYEEVQPLARELQRERDARKRTRDGRKVAV